MTSRWKLFLFIVATIVALMFFIFPSVFPHSMWERSLINPGLVRTNSQIVATPVPTSTPAPPKQYQFDSSTDLKKELESINPQVLEADFN